MKPKGSGPTSAAWKCSARRDAGSPGLPSATRISLMGQGGSGSRSQTPAAWSRRLEVSAMA